MSRAQLPWLSLLAVASAAVLWLPRLPSGLWLDGRLAGEGFSSRELFRSKFLEARLYERRGSQDVNPAK